LRNTKTSPFPPIEMMPQDWLNRARRSQHGP
jgi:hypothetical protein